MARAVVIGAGAAGLTAAAFLARDGCEVDVFEQAPHIGGVTSTIHREGLAWDVGPMALEGLGPGGPPATLATAIDDISSLHSPSMAPEGKHAMTVYTIAPNVIDGDWGLDKEKLTDSLLAEAEKIIPGLRAHASVSLTLTPREFRAMTHMPEHHSFGGYCPMLGRSGAPHRTPIEGLWFIGSQSESGPGVWTQLMSSRNVYKSLSKEV